MEEFRVTTLIKKDNFYCKTIYNIYTVKVYTVVQSVVLFIEIPFPKRESFYLVVKLP